MPWTPDRLFQRLNELGIAHATHKHPPLFTVADSKALRGDLPGGHCKSLFLKDKRGQIYLVVALEDRTIDLKRLRQALGAGTLSFGSAELLYDVLGIRPGAVSPLAVINDSAHRVLVVLDQAMLRIDPLNYHPLTNEMTTAVGPKGLIAFLEASGHRPTMLDFDEIQAPRA
jgi:Ala-tRNA(Pro) deacylase